MTALAPAFSKNLRRFQSIIALLVLCIVLSLLTDKFFTAANGLNVLRQVAVNICIATGTEPRESNGPHATSRRN